MPRCAAERHGSCGQRLTDSSDDEQAKKLAEKYPEMKCESYGFGEERTFAALRSGILRCRESLFHQGLAASAVHRGRLHLFKTAATLKAGLAKEGRESAFRLIPACLQCLWAYAVLSRVR